MLIICPQDSTTAMLAELYRRQDATVLTQHLSSTEICNSIYHIPPAPPDSV